MKKLYVVPKIHVGNFKLKVNLLSNSGKSSGTGCSCGCYSRDYPQYNVGCFNCPSCGHDNGGNHSCDDEGIWERAW